MKRRYLVVVLGLVLVATSACYGHSPTKTARQLEHGEASVSGQLRVPGQFVMPGAAGVAQYGVGGHGDLGVHGGAVPMGITEPVLPTAYAGLLARWYPTDSVIVGVEGIYNHVFRPFDWDHHDLVTPDFDHSLVGGAEVISTTHFDPWRLYGGPKGQLVVWVPDGAREDYPDLDPILKRPQFVGFNVGAVGGVEFQLSDHFALQGELMALPIGWERDVEAQWTTELGFDQSGSWIGHRTGRPLHKNRFQVTLGLNYGF